MAFKFKAKYGNYIGGKFVDPVDGKYFDNITPVNGKVLCQIPRSNEKDINLALDAAHAAKDAWGATSVTERSQILHNIAQVMEDNLATLAEAETWDNGKPIRETTNADLPLAVKQISKLHAKPRNCQFKKLAQSLIFQVLTFCLFDIMTQKFMRVSSIVWTIKHMVVRILLQ